MIFKNTFVVNATFYKLAPHLPLTADRLRRFEPDLTSTFLTPILPTLAETERDVQQVLYLCTYCKTIAIMLYSLLSIVAFLGNSLILSVFFYIRRLRTPTNMLIANLAIADLMISMFCIPLSYWHVIIFEDQRWVFGAFLCKIFNYLQATAVFLSSWTLVAISFDRFLAIWFVMSPWLRINRCKAFYIIISTWLFSLCMALPLLIVNKIEESSSGVPTCLEKWELVHGFLLLGDDEARAVQSFTSLVFALQYCLPLLVLLVTYTFIGLRMWNSKIPGEPQSLSINGTNQINCQNQERRHESVKKLIPMVLLVSALYAGCWLPQNLLMNIWVVYDPSITSHPYILYIWWGSHTLAMFHSVVNPFIYYCQNKRIYEAVNYLLRFIPCIKSTFHNQLITMNFTDETAAGVLKCSKKSMQAVRIVNMVAYMPVTSGKRTQLQSTVFSPVDNNSNQINDFKFNGNNTKKLSQIIINKNISDA